MELKKIWSLKNMKLKKYEAHIWNLESLKCTVLTPMQLFFSVYYKIYTYDIYVYMIYTHMVYMIYILIYIHLCFSIIQL